MEIKILMPALSPTMKEGNLSKWLIKEGDKISAGDIIAEIETDKATMEIEAVDEGFVKSVKEIGLIFILGTTTFALFEFIGPIVMQIAFLLSIVYYFVSIKLIHR